MTHHPPPPGAQAPIDLDLVQAPNWSLDAFAHGRPFARGGVYKPSRYVHLFSMSPERGVLFSALTTAAAVFDARHEAAVEEVLGRPSFAREQVVPELFDGLYDGGFIVPEDLDEHQLLRERLARGRGQRRQLMLTVAPTMGCNFDCVYCVLPSPFRKDNKVMSQTVQDVVVARVEEELEEETDAVHVAWYGGEPLLAVEVIHNLSRRMMRICDERGVRYSANITTNGYALNESAVAALAACRIDYLKISLDGPEELHDVRRPLRSGKGTFDRILQNLIAASETLNVWVRVNIDRGNETGTFELLDALRDAGLEGRVGVYSAMVEENPAVEGQYDEFASRREFAVADREFTDAAVRCGLGQHATPQILSHFCGADLQRGLMIGPAGELYACWGDFGDPSKRVGSLLLRTHSNQSYHCEYTDFDPTTHPKCSSCTVLPMCQGGCSRERLYLGEPQCGVYRYDLADRVVAHVRRLLVERDGTA